MSRTLISAIAAGALALSASLYPSSGESTIINSLEVPGAEYGFGLPDRIESLSIRHVVEFDDLELADVLQVATILAEHPNIVSIDTLLTLTNPYQLQSVVEIILSSGVSGLDVSALPVAFGGGGGGGGSPAMLPTTLAQWMLFLGMLLDRIPVRFYDAISGVIARMLPALVDPFGMQRVATLLTAVTAVAPAVVVPAPLPAPVPGAPPSEVPPIERMSSTVTVAPPAPAPPPAETTTVPTTYVAPPSVDETPSGEPLPSSPPPSSTDTNGPTIVPSSRPEQDGTELDDGGDDLGGDAGGQGNPQGGQDEGRGSTANQGDAGGNDGGGNSDNGANHTSDDAPSNDPANG